VADKDRLGADYGLPLVDYLPDHVYVAALDGPTQARVAADPLVRAVVPYHPEFKTAPATMSRFAAGGPGQARLDAVLFAGADPAQVGPALAERGAQDLLVVDDRAHGGPARIRFTLPVEASLDDVIRLEPVRWVEPALEPQLDSTATFGTLQSGQPDVVPLWEAGLHGEGQIIGLSDRPVDLDHCFFRDDPPRPPGPDHRKVAAARNLSGGRPDAHGTFVAGIAAGDDVHRPGAHPDRGLAWAARLTLATTADLHAGSLLDQLVTAAADGATVHSHSWHDEPDAQYSQTAVDVDTFTWTHEDCVVVGSAANRGERIGPPGTAKNALCVAAARGFPNVGQLGDGGRGPTADGRHKPELMAPGCGITSARVNGGCAVALDEVVFGFGPICASSWAAPAAAAAATLARQYYLTGFHPSGHPVATDGFTPTGALLRATLINGAMSGPPGTPRPDDAMGWGALRLDTVLPVGIAGSGPRVWDVRNSAGLVTDDSADHEVDILVVDRIDPLRVTLVWTDPPAPPGSATPTVNNLDLEVHAPDGTVYLGNVFAGGVSVPGGSPDAVNTVEAALVPDAQPGRWLIRVIARAVPVGAPGQGYALVVAGPLAADSAPAPEPDAAGPPR
jgi:hypothetical protein